MHFNSLAVPPASIKGNKVTLVGSPLDDDLITSVQNDRHHPTLNASIDARVDAATII